MFKGENGQALVEAIIAVTIIGIITASAASSLLIIIKSNETADKSQTAEILTAGLSENLIVLAGGDWHAVYDLNKGSGNKYYIATSTGELTVSAGEESINLNNFNYSRYFYIENVTRDGSGNIGIGDDDPSTQKAVITVEFSIGGVARTFLRTIYLTRWRNEVAHQTDWSGGSGQSGPVTVMNSQFDSSEYIDFDSVPGSISLPYLYLVRVITAILAG